MITNAEGYRDKAALYLGYASSARAAGRFAYARICLSLARAFRTRSRQSLPLEHLR